MDENSTLNDLIRFAYNETSILETVRILKSIESDPLVAQLYQEIQSSLEELDNLAVNPSEKSVSSILFYAKSVAMN